MAILDLFGLGGQTPFPTNQTPVDYNNVPTQPQGILNTATPPQPENGRVLGFANGNDAFFGIMRGLAAAGSPDPIKTAMMFSQNDREQQKQEVDLRASRSPKMVQIPGTPFFLMTTPDGRQQTVDSQGKPVMPGPDGVDPLQKYMIESEKRKNDFGIQKIQTQGQVNTQTGNDKVAFKADLEQAGGPGASTTFRDSVTTQLGVIDKLITGIPEIDKIKTQFGDIKSPAIANFIDATVGRVAGTDAYSLRRDFDSLIGEDVLKLAERMKGALSDKDVMFLKSIQPKADDPTDRKITYLTELKKRLDEGEKRRMEAAQRVAGQGSNSAPAGGAPKSSGGVVSVTNEQEWQALPPGTVYRDPTGVIRTKK